MRLKLLLLFLVIFGLLCDLTLAGKDRKKSKNKNRHQDEQEEDDEERRGGSSGLGISEGNRKETKDRVMDLQERAEDRKDRHEKREEESSEEKNKDEKSNSTAAGEIIIPSARFRRHKNSENLGLQHLRRHRRQETKTHSLKRTSEINDGLQTALDTKPQQDHQCGPNCEHKSRSRRHQHEEHTFKRAPEINDGEQTALENRPVQDHQCGANCKHNKRDVGGGDTLTFEIDGTPLIRTRRANGGKKDIGHRAAAHPHTSKQTGIKAGRRRGKDGQKANNRKEEARRHARHAKHEIDAEKKQTNYFDEDIIEANLKEVREDTNRHGHRQERRPRIAAEDPVIKGTKYMKTDDDRLVVAADSATITDF